jgi:hypothetical protein
MALFRDAMTTEHISPAGKPLLVMGVLPMRFKADGILPLVLRRLAGLAG